MRLALALVAATLACKGKPRDEATPPPAAPRDAAPVADAGRWTELAAYPRVEAVRSHAVPSRHDIPRYDVGGPILVGDLAVVASSQSGFLGIDWRTGQVLWSKPAGAHVAPPLAWGSNLALLGDCLAPPAVPADEVLLACLRVVTPAGVDEAYLAVRGQPGALGGFEEALGPQQLYAIGDRAIRWTRGDAAVTIDPATGIATRAREGRPPLAVEWQGQRWDLAHAAGGPLVATQAGKRAWATAQEYAALLGVVHRPPLSPLVRVLDVRMVGDQPQIHLHDLDATGSLRGAVETSAAGAIGSMPRPLPGIALLGWATSPHGDAALAVRMDTSLRRDFVAGYSRTAQLGWVWPLPETPRADPVGVAVADDAVVVFHDGDTLTILPTLWAPSTAPGAGSGPSGSATP